MVHTVFHYVKDNYTTKKEYDLVKIQSDHYKNIMEEIQNIKYQETMLPSATDHQMILHDPYSKSLETSLLDVLMEEGGL